PVAQFRSQPLKFCNDAIAFGRVGLAVALRRIVAAIDWNIGEMPIRGGWTCGSHIVRPSRDRCQGAVSQERLNGRHGATREPLLRDFCDDRMSFLAPRKRLSD